ncbi:MAG: cytochrome c oxidase assembly factor Coa1 family protein [Planctomycetota bacterium]
MNDTPNPPAAKVPWYVAHPMRSLLLTVLGVVAFGLLVFSVVALATMGRLKQSDPYRLALATAAGHPSVQSALGRPVEAGFFAAGLVDEAEAEAELTMRLRGPAGIGTVRAIAERFDPATTPATPARGGWRLVFLDVATFSDFGTQVVDIVNERPPTGVDLPEPTPEAKEKYGVGNGESGQP